MGGAQEVRKEYGDVQGQGIEGSGCTQRPGRGQHCRGVSTAGGGHAKPTPAWPCGLGYRDQNPPQAVHAPRAPQEAASCANIFLYL